MATSPARTTRRNTAVSGRPATVVELPVGRRPHGRHRHQGTTAWLLAPEARQLRAAVLAWSLAAGTPLPAAALTAVLGAKSDSREPLTTWRLTSLAELCGPSLVPWLADLDEQVSAEEIASAVVGLLRYQLAVGLGPHSDPAPALVAASARLGLTSLARRGPHLAR
jgi:hypothetical protein